MSQISKTSDDIDHDETSNRNHNSDDLSPNAIDANTVNATSGTVTSLDGTDLQYESVNTDELNNAATIQPGTGRTKIHSALTDDSLVVFEAGNHFVSDRIESQAAETTILVQPGAHIKIEDAATPTTITDSSANDYTAAIYISHDDVSVINRGVIDGNDTNHSQGVPVMIDTVSGGSVDSQNGELRDTHDGIFAWDSSDLSITHCAIENPAAASTATVIFEGCTNCYAGDIAAIDAPEAVDLNGINEHIQLNNIRGRNATDILDINGSQNVNVSNVMAVGSGSENIFTISGTEGTRLSSKTALGSSDQISVSGISGRTTGQAIETKQDGPVTNIKISDMDVVSTGDHAVRLQGRSVGMLDGLRLEGRAESTGTDTHAVYIGGDDSGANALQKGATLDIETVGTGYGAIIEDFGHVTGNIKAHDCGGKGLLFVGVDHSPSDSEIQVHAHDNVDNGVSIQGGGSDVTVRGRCYGNSSVDINTQGVIGVEIWADYETRSKGGTRNQWHGLGYNLGDPSVGGDWNGFGREGVKVRDTTNNNTYLYNDGSWSQIADT